MWALAFQCTRRRPSPCWYGRTPRRSPVSVGSGGRCPSSSDRVSGRAGSRFRGLWRHVERTRERDDLIPRPPQQTEGGRSRESNGDRGDHTSAVGDYHDAAPGSAVSAGQAPLRPTAGVQRIERFATTSSSTGEPAVESDGDFSQMTVSRGATNAGATRPSRSSPATSDPTA